MQFGDAIFQVSAQREQLLERAAYSGFGIVFVIERAPIFGEETKTCRGFGGGKSCAAAIDGAHSGAIQFAEGFQDRFLIGVQQTDKCAAHQEIEARQGDQRGAVVEKIARGFFHQTGLLEFAAFEQIAKTAAVLDEIEGGFECGAPIGGGRARFAENRLKDAAHVGGGNFIVIKTFGGAQGEILDQEKIDLVAIGGGLLRFIQMTLNEGAQSFFFRVQSCGRELANLEGFYLRVHFIEPAEISFDDGWADFFWDRFAFGIRSGGNFELARECGVDGIGATSFGPGGGEIGRGRGVWRQSGSRTHWLHSAGARLAQG